MGHPWPMEHQKEERERYDKYIEAKQKLQSILEDLLPQSAELVSSLEDFIIRVIDKRQDDPSW